MNVMPREASRFLDKMEPQPNGCWLWTGAKGRKGYGSFAFRGRIWIVHRFAYTWLAGPILDGLHIDHLCRNTSCVNPDHMEPVTPVENNRRARMLKTHCKQGHPFDAENTHVNSRGHRGCRSCWRADALARYNRVRGDHYETNCHQCGTALVSPRRTQRFCSERCSGIAYKAARRKAIP